MANPLGIGGRKKGTPNKNRQVLLDKAKELGVDPFQILLLFAKGDWKALGYDSAETVTAITKDGQKIFADRISPELRQKSAKDASEYLYPKRKAVELTGEDGGPVDFNNVSKDEIDQRIKELLSGKNEEDAND